MVTLVWGGGEEVLGGGVPPPLVFNYSKEALGGGGVRVVFQQLPVKNLREKQGVLIQVRVWQYWFNSQPASEQL